MQYLCQEISNSKYCQYIIQWKGLDVFWRDYGIHIGKITDQKQHLTVKQGFLNISTNNQFLKHDYALQNNQ